MLWPVRKHRLPVKLMAVLWLATYVVCVGLVCSFILFEVLDIDGSDFPAPPLSTVATPIKLAEPVHEIKRALLSGALHLWTLVAMVVVLVHSAQSRQQSARLRVPLQFGSHVRRGRCMTLPRASLADAASA